MKFPEDIRLSGINENSLDEKTKVGGNCRGSEIIIRETTS